MKEEKCFDHKRCRKSPLWWIQLEIYFEKCKQQCLKFKLLDIGIKAIFYFRFENSKGYLHYLVGKGQFNFLTDAETLVLYISCIYMSTDLKKRHRYPGIRT